MEFSMITTYVMCTDLGGLDQRNLNDKWQPHHMGRKRGELLSKLHNILLEFD